MNGASQHTPHSEARNRSYGGCGRTLAALALLVCVCVCVVLCVGGWMFVRACVFMCGCVGGCV
jgi:hypothetical protein